MASPQVSSWTPLGTFQTLKGSTWRRRSEAHQVIDALIHKPDDYNSSPAAWSYVTFPQLQKLEISGRRIEGEEIRALQDCLIERCERNAPIQALTIQPGVDVAKEDVALLREIVVDFKVK